MIQTTKGYRGIEQKKNEEKTASLRLLVLPAGDAGDEVHIERANPLGPVPKFVPEEQAKEDGDGQIVSDKRSSVPFTVEKDAPLGAEDDDDGPHQTPPRGVRHESAPPREVLRADTLGLQPMPESNAGDADAEPVEHSGDGAHVGEPGEDVARGLGDGEVGQTSESGGNGQRVNGSSLGVGAGEDLGSLTIFSEAVQGTGGGV